MRFFIFCFGMFLIVGCSQNEKNSEAMVQSENFDWQGHRGARGLAPENTIPAFLKALEYPVKTLELDVVISKDSQVVVSHEPWMSATICQQPDGTPVSESEEKQFNIFNLTWTDIQQFDCGSRGHTGFPEQESAAVHKPLLREVIAAVQQYCREKGREEPFYNIEIKSNLEWDDVYTPEPGAFAQLLMNELKHTGIENRTCIQSFDVRALQAARAIDDDLVLALLIGNAGGLDANLETLGFVPEIYSPHHALVTVNLVEKVHEAGMKIIPWTVNDMATMQALIQLGVDGIITDYPNLIATVGKE